MHQPQTGQDELKPDKKETHHPRLPIIFAIAVSLFGVALYLGTLGFDLIWDDLKLFQDPESPAAGPLIELWTQPFLIGDGRYFRPLVMSSFWFERALFGPEPVIFHATQILLYGLSVLMLFLVAKTIFDTGSGGREAAIAAGIAAALFAAHPVHVETVAFVSCRTDLLSGLFTLAFVWLTLRAAAPDTKNDLVWTAAASLALFTGLLSKESTVVAPVLAAAALMATYGLTKRTLLRVGTGYLLAGLLYAVIRLQALNGADSPGLTFGSWPEITTTWAINLQLLFAPIRLRVIHFAVAQEYQTLITTLGTLAFVGFIALTCMLKRWPKVALAACWTLVGVLPTLGIVKINLFLTSERYLFIASAGVSLFAGVAALHLLRRGTVAKNAVMGGALLLVILIGGHAFTRQAVYRNSEILFRQIILEEPEKAYGHEALGELLLKRQEYQQAAVHLEHSENAKSSNQLGTAYIMLGRVADAIRVLETAFSEYGTPELASNLGQAYIMVKRTTDAERVLKVAVRLDPELAEAHANLGIVLKQQQRYKEAVRQFETAVSLSPDNPEVLYNLGNLYAKIGRLDEAIATYSKVLQIKPGHRDAKNNLSVVTRWKSKASQ